MGTVIRKTKRQTAPGRTEHRGRPLLCAHCRHLITYEAEQIDIAGAHRHHFENPAGMRYLIGCFADAPGVGRLGAATLEATWFSGYAWQVCLCHGCGAHMGWRYQRSGEGFFGLILDQLVPGE